MAANIHPLLPHENNGLRLPIPPPPLMTRGSHNELYEAPSTPSHSNYNGFTTPQQTPQGSPSKNQMPPGAYDLPNVFDNALKLQSSFGNQSNPGSPVGKSNSRQNLIPASPTKNVLQNMQDYNAGVDLPDYGAAGMQAPASPTRQSNKENAPAGILKPALKKESSFQNQAAQARPGAYRANELERPTQTLQRGLSSQDLEKLSKPAVKRIANVTQLCKKTPLRI